jgi:hypothetical protein
VLKIHADARPRAKPPTHRIDEYVGWFEISHDLRVTTAPALESGQRIFFPLRTSNLDQRVLGDSSS